MATKHTFGVKSTEHGWSGELTIMKPDNVSDETWNDHVSTSDDVNELAFSNLVIKFQGKLRSCKTFKEATELLPKLVYGQRIMRERSVEVVHLPANMKKFHDDIQAANPTAKIIYDE